MKRNPESEKILPDAKWARKESSSRIEVKTTEQVNFEVK